MSDTRWEQYYKAVAGRAPRALFLKALAMFEANRFAPGAAQAIDLGCGDGTETVTLLAQGWRVHAVDREPGALERVLALAPDTARHRLTTEVAAFDAATLPAADLVYAGLSLPFCPPERFDAAWANMSAALKPGGRFAGHLFGVRDGWSDQPDMTFFNSAGVRERIAAFAVEYFAEEENDRPTALGEAKHWHIFEIIARRRV